MAEGADESTEITILADDPQKTFSWTWLLRIVGPAMLVCLADTDTGSLIVAAQSGALWGYSLLLLEIVLTPILYFAQELTVRLAIYTRQGHTACIRDHFGKGWAWFACIILVVECVCAIISEMSGITSVAELWGVNSTIAAILSAIVILFTVFFLDYRKIEIIGVSFGLFELVFVVTMFIYHPNILEVLEGCVTFYTDASYMALIAANVGGVIMPWMIYFQQSAIVARGLKCGEEMEEERTQTLLGSIVTQLIMIGILITVAAATTLYTNLETVADIVDAIEPVLGYQFARICVSFGFVGGSMCAAFVVSLASSWAVIEALGLDATYSLEQPPTQAPIFYACFSSVVVVGVIIMIFGVNIVKLNILVDLLDGLLVPFTLGFLFFLASGDALPPRARLRGVWKYVLGGIFITVSLLALVCGFLGLV